MATWLNIKKKDIELEELHEIFNNSPKDFYIKWFDGTKSKNHYEIEIRHNEGIDVKKEFFKELERIRKEKNQIQKQSTLDKMEKQTQLTITDNRGQELKIDDIDKAIKEADTLRLDNLTDSKKEYWTDIYQKLSEIKKIHTEVIQKGQEMYAEEKYDEKNRLIYCKNDNGDTIHRKFGTDGKLNSQLLRFKNGQSQFLLFDNDNEGNRIVVKDIQKNEEGTRREERLGDDFQNHRVQKFNKYADLIFESKTIVEDASVGLWRDEAKHWDYNDKGKLELTYQSYEEKINNDRVMVGGSINEIAGKSLTDKNYLQLFDKDLQNTIEIFLEVKPNVQPMPLTADEHLAMAQLWKKELDRPTKISEGLNKIQIEAIAEKHNQQYNEIENRDNMEKQTQTTEPQINQTQNELEKQKSIIVDFLEKHPNKGISIGTEERKLSPDKQEHFEKFIPGKEILLFSDTDKSFHLKNDSEKETNIYQSVVNSDDMLKELRSKNEFDKEQSELIGTWAKMIENNQVKNVSIKDIVQNTEVDEKLQYLQDKVKYLGLGDSQEVRDKVAQIYHGELGKSQMTTTSDRVMSGNKVAFNLNFNKTEKGVFLNSYQATLTTKKGEERTHTFNVQNNNVKAKEAINLLEGRAVKMKFEKLDTSTGEITQDDVFVKLKLNEEKTEKGNYKLEGYNMQKEGIDTDKIIQKSNIIGTPEQLENVKKHLEKGNITSVTFQHEQKEIKGYAVLNPQWKMLNLYDEKMSRVNSNRQSLEINTEQNQKNNVLQQKNGRSI